MSLCRHNLSQIERYAELPSMDYLEMIGLTESDYDLAELPDPDTLADTYNHDNEFISGKEKEEVGSELFLLEDLTDGEGLWAEWMEKQVEVLSPPSPDRLPTAHQVLSPSQPDCLPSTSQNSSASTSGSSTTVDDVPLSGITLLDEAVDFDTVDPSTLLEYLITSVSEGQELPTTTDPCSIPEISSASGLPLTGEVSTGSTIDMDCLASLLDTQKPSVTSDSVTTDVTYMYASPEPSCPPVPGIQIAMEEIILPRDDVNIGTGIVEDEDCKQNLLMMHSYASIGNPESPATGSPEGHESLVTFDLMANHSLESIPPEEDFKIVDVKSGESSEFQLMMMETEPEVEIIYSQDQVQEIIQLDAGLSHNTGYMVVEHEIAAVASDGQSDSDILSAAMTSDSQSDSDNLSHSSPEFEKTISDDSDWSPSPSTRRKPYSRPSNTCRLRGPLAVIERKQRKKEQNKTAATRYRVKRQNELNDLKEQEACMENKNKELKEKVTSLSTEIGYLKNLMRDVLKARGYQIK